MPPSFWYSVWRSCWQPVAREARGRVERPGGDSRASPCEADGKGCQAALSSSMAGQPDSLSERHMYMQLNRSTPSRNPSAYYSSSTGTAQIAAACWPTSDLSLASLSEGQHIMIKSWAREERAASAVGTFAGVHCSFLLQRGSPEENLTPAMLMACRQGTLLTCAHVQQIVAVLPIYQYGRPAAGAGVAPETPPLAHATDPIAAGTSGASTNSQLKTMPAHLNQRKSSLKLSDLHANAPARMASLAVSTLHHPLHHPLPTAAPLPLSLYDMMEHVLGSATPAARSSFDEAVKERSVGGRPKLMSPSAARLLLTHAIDEGRACHSCPQGSSAHSSPETAPASAGAGAGADAAAACATRHIANVAERDRSCLAPAGVMTLIALEPCSAGHMGQRMRNRDYVCTLREAFTPRFYEASALVRRASALLATAYEAALGLAHLDACGVLDLSFVLTPTNILLALSAGGEDAGRGYRAKVGAYLSRRTPCYDDTTTSHMLLETLASDVNCKAARMRSLRGVHRLPPEALTAAASGSITGTPSLPAGPHSIQSLTDPPTCYPSRQLSGMTTVTTNLTSMSMVGMMIDADAGTVSSDAFSIEPHSLPDLHHTDTTFTTPAAATPQLTSPAVQRSPSAAAVYQLGLILFEAAVGQEVFSELTPAGVAVGLASASLRVEVPSGMPPCLARVISACTHPDPQQRLLLADVPALLAGASEELTRAVHQARATRRARRMRLLADDDGGDDDSGSENGESAARCAALPRWALEHVQGGVNNARLACNGTISEADFT